MWDLTTTALDTAKLRGATYADVRSMHIRQRDLTTKNGAVGTLAQSESIGIGIRALANGAWGFTSTDKLTREGVSACAAQAVSIAKASALAKRGEVKMVPENAYIDSWQAPLQKDPFEIPLESQLDLLLKADAAMRVVKGVTLTETDMQFRKIDSWYASSIGSRIHQRKVISGCGIVATSFKGTEIQKRSYPNSFGGQFQLAGYELIEWLDLLRHAPRVAQESVALHSAAQCPEKTGTLLLDGSQLGLQIHESVAHPIGLSRSSGTMRTESWNRLPIIRMTNISIKPGIGSPEELIASTDDGIWMETNRSWSIDDRRYQFQFSTEIAWEIKGGKKVRLLKNPSYSGITTEFWNSCDAICGEEYWTLW